MHLSCFEGKSAGTLGHAPGAFNWSAHPFDVGYRNPAGLAQGAVSVAKRLRRRGRAGKAFWLKSEQEEGACAHEVCLRRDIIFLLGWLPAARIATL